MPSPFDIALQQLVERGAPLPPNARSAAAASLQQWSDTVSQDILDAVTQKFFDGIRNIVAPREGETPGETPSSLRDSIQKLLLDYDDPQSLAGKMNLDFKIDTAQRVAMGAGKFIADQANVDAYPAWELEREFDRDVPRGFRRGPGGELIEVPDDDWPSRFRDAATAAGDEDALRVLDETDRMIALKSSGVWEELGNNRDDCLGNPFAPFAFNSGYRTSGVHRSECIELGLLDADEKPEGTDFDFSQLISLPE